jgi:hypothetical protein
MAMLTTERIKTDRPAGRRQTRTLVRFFALDGAMRVVVEADNEDDARYLCREMRWDFICFCDN